MSKTILTRVIVTLALVFIIPFSIIAQKTFVDSTNVNCSYANGVATIYPSPINIPANVATNATGNITVTFKYAGQLLYSYEYLTLYGENNYFLSNSNLYANCPSTFSSQNITIPQSTYANWLSDGQLIFGISSTTYVNNSCSFKSYSNINFCTKIIVSINYYEYPDDAGVTSFIAPLQNTNSGSQPIVIQGLNFGTDSLSSVNIGWSVNGTPQTGKTLSFSPSIAPNNTFTDTIGNYNFANSASYLIKSWTNSPNGNLDSLAANDTARTSTCVGFSGTYTVGNSTASFKNLNDAFNNFKGCGISGPVTLNFVDSTYERIEIITDSISGYSQTNNITINGNGNTVWYFNDYTNRSIIDLNGADYLVFDSLNLKNNSTSYGWGFWLHNSADNNTIKNCTIDNDFITGTSNANSGGIVFSNLYYGLYNGDNGSYNTIENNNIIGAASGVSIISTNVTSQVNLGNKIKNNLFKNQLTYGIYLNYTDSTLIENNEAINPKLINSTQYFLYSRYDKNLNVNGNYIHNFIFPKSGYSFYGFYLYYSDATSVNPHYFYNNIIEDPTDDYYFYGLYNYYSDYVNFYHNTIRCEDDNYLNQSFGIYDRYGYYSNYKNNNLYFDLKNNNNYHYGIYYYSNSTAIYDDYNNVYFKDQGTYQYYGYASGYRKNLSDWKIYYYRGPNSFEINPIFVNDSSSAPKNVSLNNTGTTSLGITKDFYGITRNSPPDVGAIEFTPPNNDLALVSVNLPDSGCGLNAAQIIFEVGNFGINSYSTFNGYYQVDNGSLVSQTFTSSMPSGVVSNFTFDSIANFPTSGQSYNVNVWISATNDSDPLNDSLLGNSVKNISPTLILSTDSLYEPVSSNSYPIYGNFANGWTASPSSATGYFWTTDNFYTQSSTGPYYDHTYGNTNSLARYFYTETYSSVANQIATLTSPCIEISDTTQKIPILKFWYHKYGYQMGDLYIQIGSGESYFTIDSIIGQTHFGYSNSDPWDEKVIDLTSYRGQAFNLRFKAVSGVGTYADMALDDIKIVYQPLTCDSISSVIVSQLNDTSVDFSWESNFGASNTQIQWGQKNFTLGNGSNDSTANNFFHIGGLSNLTDYDFYIREKCADGGFTVWSGPFSIFTNNYCKTSLHNNGCDVASGINSVQLGTIQNTTSGCSGSANNFYSFYQNQQTDLEAEENYTIDLLGEGSYRIYFGVWIDYNKDGDFDDVSEFVGTVYAANSSTPVAINFTIPNGVDTGITMMRVRSDYNNLYSNYSCTYLAYGETEDYLVRLLPPPTCKRPQNLGAGFETTTSTRLFWNSRGTGSNWEIEYGSGTLTKGNGTTVNSTDSSYILTGLNAYSNYSYYVRTICGAGDTSKWAGPLTFNTYPYCYNGLHTLGCSQSTPYDVGLVQLNTINNITNNCPPGSFSNFSNLTTDLLPSNSYQLTIGTNNQASLNMGVWIDFNNDGDFNDANEFVLSGTSNSITNLTGLISVPLNAVTGNTVMRVRSSNNSINSSTSCTSLYYGETEDYIVNILPAPTCPSPNNLNVSNITSSSANVYWTSIGSGSKWLVQYDTVGFSLGSGNIDSSTSTNYTVNNLLLFGSYDVYIKEICSSSDSSTWTGPITFNVNPYCTTNLHYSYSNCTYEIDSVKLGTLNYYDQGEPCPPFSYHEMFSYATSLYKLDNYTLRVRGNANDYESIGVWIDWNGDGSFNTTDEFLGYSYRAYNNIFTANISVPLSAKTGRVLMRVRSYNSTTINSTWGCVNLGYGETMDFPIDILNPQGCVTPFNLASNFASFTSANISWTDYSNTNLFEIEYDTTGYTFGTGTRIFSTDTFEVIQNLAQNGFYDFYVRAICDTADTSAWSSSHTFTTFPYCSGNTTTLLSPSYSCYYKLSEFQLDTFYRDYSSKPCPTNSYSFEPTIINIEAGTNIPISYNATSSFTSTSPSIAVWIDYNQDGDFDDAGEFVSTASRYNTKPFSSNITIPSTANVGTTIMRVRTTLNAYLYSNNSCNTNQYGDVTDFVVNILPPPTCPKPYNLTLYGNPSTTAARVGFSSLGNGNTWEVKAVIKNQLPTSSGVTTYRTNIIDSIRGLTPFTEYDIYVREICTVGDTSNYSGPLSIVTNPYCAASFTSDCNTSSYFINSVTYNGDTLGGVGCSGNANNYSFTDLRSSGTNLSSGNNYSITVNLNLTRYTYAWIDWNKDGLFSSAEAEYLGFGTTPRTLNLSIPTAFYGNLMIRIRSSYFTLYNYDFCSTESYGETEDYLFYVDLPACPGLTNLTSNSTTDSSITVSWQQLSADSNSLFNIYVSEIGNSFDTVISQISSNPYIINGLKDATLYSVKVQNNCSSRGDSLSTISDSIVVQTDCGFYSANYTQGFDGPYVGNFPVCWEIQDYSALTNNAGYTTGNVYSGFRAFYTYRNYSTFYYYEQYLLSPKFDGFNDGDKQVRFFAKSPTAGNRIIIGTTRDNYSANSYFNVLDTINLSSGYQQYFIDLKNAVSGDNRIAFKFESSPYSYIYIDEFHYETKPACKTPQNIRVSNISNNSVVVSWDTLTSSNYLLSYGFSSSGINGINNGFLINKSTNIDTITGLSPNTSYQVAVKQLCTLDSSFWNGPLTFTTKCNPDSAPTIENFTGVLNNNIPSCWNQPSTAIIPWRVDQYGTSSATGPYYDGDGVYGGKYIYMEASSGTVADSGVIFTPLIATHNLTAPYLYFDYHAYGNGIGTFKVSVSDDFGTTWYQLFKSVGATRSSRTALFENFQIGLKNYKNKTLLFKISGTKTGINGDMAFDNFKVDEAPPCGDPYSLAVLNNYFGNSATLNWEGSDSTISYKINFGSGSPALGAGTVINNGTSKNYNLTNLSPNTSYRFYVKAICSNDSTNWVGPITFNTPCSPVMAPLTEDFASTYYTPSACWNNTSSTGEFWQFGNTTLSANPAYSGSHYAFINDNNSTVTSDFTLETPTVIIDTLTTPILSFWYWSANNSGSLNIQALQNGNWVNLKSLNKSTNRSWENIIVDLANVDDTTRIRFIGAESAIFSNNYQAIDLIEIKNGDLKDLSIDEIFASSGNCGTNNYSISVSVSNTGISNSTGNLTLLIDDSLSYANTISVNSLSSNVSYFNNLNLSGGKKSIKAYFTSNTGDNNSTNDTLAVNRFFIGETLISVLGDSSCSQTDTLTISASGADEFLWYENSNGTNFISSSSNILLNNLSSSKTYYVKGRSNITSKGGLENFSSYTTLTESDKLNGLIFDVFSPLSLDSLTVYPNGSGDVVIKVTNKFGVTVGTKTVNVPNSFYGAQRIPVGINIPAGENYKITLEGTTAITWFRSNTNMANGVYPIEDDESLVSIKSSTVGPGQYSYFYDWKVSTQTCFSSLTPVTASIIQLTPPTSSGGATYCEGDAVQPLSVVGDSANLYWYKSTDLNNPVGFGNSFNPSTASGNTTYRVREAQGNCYTAYSDQTVIIKPNAVAQITSDTAICQGTTVRLYGSGGSKLTWSNNSTLGSILVGPSSTTQYYVIADYQNGCKKDTAYTTVFVNQKPTLSLNNPAPICVGDTATLIASSTQSISWSNSLGNNDTVLVTPNTTANFSVTATDSIGCSNTQSVSVVVNSLPNINAGTYQTYCPGDTVTLTASGGTSFIWNNVDSSSSITTVLNSDSTFNVIGFDQNGCQNSDQVTVTLKTNLNVFAGNDTSISAGNIVNLNAIVNGGSGNYNYSWTPDSLVINSSSASTSTVALSKTSILTFEVDDNNNGCSATDNLAINIIGGVVTANPTSSKNNICAGDSIQLFANAGGATGNYTYNWSPGYLFNDSTIANPMVYPTSNKVFSVEVTEGGSSANESISIVVRGLPLSSITADTATCLGENVTLRATGGVSYAWSNNSYTDSARVSPIFPTNYKVTITGNNGCSSIEEVNVAVKSLPTPTIAGYQKVCIGDSVTLTANGGNSYQWINGGTNSSETFMVNNAQNFSVIATGQNGCSKTANYYVSIDTLPHVDAGTNQNLCAGDTATLTANGALTYSWSNNINGQTILVSPSSTSEYFVYGTDINGCTGIDSITVNLNMLPTVSAGNDTAICIGDTAKLNASGGTYYFWNSGSSVAENNVTPASTSTYIVTVANNNGCYNYDTVTVTVNTLPTANAGLDKEICLNQSVSLTASGGTSYSWSNNVNTATITVSPSTSTNYQVVVTDQNSCSSSDSVFVKVNALPNANAGQDLAVCYLDSAQLSASGGVTYAWSSGSSSASTMVYSLSNTVYTVTVTDTNNCSATDQVNLTINALPNISAGSDTTVCSGVPALLNATGGNNYSWSNGDTTQSILVSPATTQNYIVVGTDGNGCSNIDTAMVYVNQLPSASASSDTAICIGDTATLRAFGGDYYFWNNGGQSSEVKVSPTSTSSYIVTVANVSGCFSYDTVTVNVNSLPIVDAGQDTSVCIGSNQILTASGGASNTDYIWSSNHTFYSIAVNPTVNTMYSVTATDANGCKNTDSVLVVVNPLPIANAGLDTTICFGDTAFLSANGGTSYNWSNNSATQNTLVTPTSTNNFIVTVTDGNGCSSNDTITIFVNQLPNVIASADTFTCWGAPVSIGVSGANSFTWSDGDTNSSRLVSPVINTTYSVVGTDGNGCSNSDSVNVTVNVLPSASTSNDTSICIGDSATLKAFGGDYYFWNNGGQSSEIKVSPTSTSSYIVTVATLSGCFDYDTVTVIVNSLPIANAGLDTSICLGTSATLSATGGNFYTWNNGNQNATIFVSPDSTLEYSVTVTDFNNCSSSDAVIVNVFELPIVDAGVDQTVCEKSQVTFTASGVGNFVWSNGDSAATSIFNATDTMSYIVSLTDSNSCVNYDTTTVYTLSLPNAQAGADTSICLGDSAQLSANGGLYYIWNNGGQTSSIKVSPAQTSTYVVTVVDQNSCFSIDSINVNIWQLPNANAGLNDTICFGDQTSLTATGGVSYVWNTGAQTASIFASPVADSNYVVSVTDANGCVNLDSTMVIVNALPQANAGSNQTICLGDTVTLTATGGVNYQWSNQMNGASINVSPIATNQFTVTVTNANNCQAIDSVQIIVNPLPNAFAGKDTSLCWGASTTLIATGGVSYVWSNGPQTASNFINPSIATSYIVTVTDANNCVNTDTINVGINNLPTATVSSNKVICQNDSVELVASGGLYYYWSSGQSSSTIKVSPGFTSTFMVTVADVNGCFDIDSVDVTVNPLPSVSLFPFSQLCDNGNLTTLTGGSPIGGVYSGPFVSGNKFNPKSSGAGTFKLFYSLTNSFGCSDSIGQNIIVNAAPNVVFPNLGRYCEDEGSVALSGGSPSGGNYSGLFVTGNTFFPSNSGPGSFSVNYTYTDAKGCSNQDTAGIIINPLPQPNLGKDTTICVNIPYKLDPGTFVSYQWSNAATTPTIEPTKAGIYSVTVTDINGCVNTDEIEISIDICPSVDELSGEGFEISYYPNPAKDFVNLIIDGRRLTNVQLIMTDINGSIIRQQSIPFITEGVSIPIDLSGISTGVYFIKLNTDRGIRVDKITIN